MKCENCPALRREGYEYPEEYCAAGVPENGKMVTDGGCKYALKTILRRVRRLEEMKSHQYDGVTEWFEEEAELDKAMKDSLNDILADKDAALCYLFGGEYHLYFGDGRFDNEIAFRIRTEYEEAETAIQESYCDRCRWRDRHQKCTACRRNRNRRDLFEEKKEASE